MLPHDLIQSTRRGVSRQIGEFLGRLLVDVKGAARGRFRADARMVVAQVPQCFNVRGGGVHLANTGHIDGGWENPLEFPEAHLRVVQLFQSAP